MLHWYRQRWISLPGILATIPAAIPWIILDKLISFRILKLTHPSQVHSTQPPGLYGGSTATGTLLGILCRGNNQTYCFATIECCEGSIVYQRSPDTAKARLNFLWIAGENTCTPGTPSMSRLSTVSTHTYAQNHLPVAGKDFSTYIGAQSCNINTLEDSDYYVVFLIYLPQNPGQVIII